MHIAKSISTVAVAALLAATGLSLSTTAEAQSRRATPVANARVAAPTGAQPLYAQLRDLAFTSALPAPSGTLIVIAASEDDLAQRGLDAATQGPLPRPSRPPTSNTKLASRLASTTSPVGAASTSLACQRTPRLPTSKPQAQSPAAP